jgi:PucR family transcriptional regulator, purine catabolism regulatory protein
VPLTLAAVLGSPALLHSRPQLLAGDPAARTVRWVHSSEIYDIARLLRGGELLLTTGLGLERSSPDERRAYVRALAEREIAGLALELAASFSEAPPEMVEEARRLDLPFVVLREVYPFVEVTEQVNSAILDSSIGRLRHADDVGRALSLVLAERGGLDLLTSTLAELVARPVVLTDATGAVLAAAADDPQDVLRSPSVTAAVTADGIELGGLVIGAGATDDDLLQAAIDRAPEIFALEVLRSRAQPLLTGRDRRELIARMLSGASEPAALEAHAAASGIRADVRWVGLAIGPTERGFSLAQDVARQAGVRVLAAEVDGASYALMALPGSDPHEAMARVRSGLRSSRGPLTAVGPVVPAASAGRSLRSAAQALLLGARSGSDERPLLAEELVVERLLGAVGDSRHLADLVEEQLGPLLRTPRAETLVRTLEAYLDSGGSKAATARVLHLRRQSVHQRLARIAALLGCDLDDARQQTALRLALAARRLP